jgi:Protein of unknown function (DUF1588)/Protein of unknown function (DUF1592)/Protein of unknown function (DUF1585)
LSHHHSFRRTSSSRLLLTGLLALTTSAAACVGNIGDEDADPEAKVPSTPTNFVCDENIVQVTLPLRRLSHTQYVNAVSDLLRHVLPAEADAVIAELAPLFDQVPDDQRIGPEHYARFSRLDQAVQQDHVDATYDVANAVGAALGVGPRLAEVFGSCAADADPSNDDICVDEFIRSFGERALRRAVTDDDVAFYRQPAGVAPFDAADYADVAALMLTSPWMLYVVEHGPDGSDAEKVALGPYEIASRLSLHFWQTIPDEELLAAARSGELASDDGYRAQVERVFAHPRTKAALGAYFGEWLENTDLDDLDSRLGMPVFDAFIGDFTPGPDLRARMLQEVVDSALYYGYDAEGTLEDFYANNRSFAKTDDLASLYGAPVWDGSSEPPVMADAARTGLLTRAAFLATGSANTRPIMKGVFVRTALLCDEIPAPPANAAATPPDLSANLTTREVVEELTHQGSCAGCHQTVINALGFATENFDALGRVRSEQTFYDEATGAVVGSKPVDTVSEPRVESADDSISNGAADLTQLILDSPKPYACFTRQYFRFTFGRIEDLDADACALADVKQALDDGRPLTDVLRTIALSDQFRERTFLSPPDASSEQEGQ